MMYSHEANVRMEAILVEYEKWVDPWVAGMMTAAHYFPAERCYAFQVVAISKGDGKEWELTHRVAHEYQLNTVLEVMKTKTMEFFAKEEKRNG